MEPKPVGPRDTSQIEYALNILINISKIFLKIRQVQRDRLHILRVQQMGEGKSKQIF